MYDALSPSLEWSKRIHHEGKSSYVFKFMKGMSGSAWFYLTQSITDSVNSRGYQEEPQEKLEIDDGNYKITILLCVCYINCAPPKCTNSCKFAQ